jgi:hypothetical protein
MLILTHYIADHELKPLLKYFDLKDVLEGAQKVVKNLAVQVKAPCKIAGAKFFKVRIGRNVKGRMIVFVLVDGGKVVPVLIRLKKDSLFGMNMSMNNKEVVQEVKKNLWRVLDDIENGRYEKFKL